MVYNPNYNPTLRLVKNQELTWNELDNNFSNLQLEFGVVRTELTGLSNRITNIELNNPGILPPGNNNGDTIIWNGAVSRWLPQPLSTLPTGTANSDVLQWSSSTSSWVVKSVLDCGVY